MLTSDDIALSAKRCPDITDLYKECMERYAVFDQAPQRCRSLRRQVTDCASDHPFYKNLLDSFKNSTAEERKVIIANLKKE